jgi:hypothetical protein
VLREEERAFPRRTLSRAEEHEGKPESARKNWNHDPEAGRKRSFTKLEEEKPESPEKPKEHEEESRCFDCSLFSTLCSLPLATANCQLS